MKIEIRPIQPSDNLTLAEVIKTCLEEHDAAIDGTMYTDPSLYKLYEWFDRPKSMYWVAVADGEVVGGSGIAPVPGEENVAELQRMFLSQKARGTGTASKLMEECISFARKEGFMQVYLETLPNMQAAQKLYSKFGFEKIDKAIGNTGHFACDIKMALGLKAGFSTSDKNSSNQ